jgi:hypothetical protein
MINAEVGLLQADTNLQLASVLEFELSYMQVIYH